jgi:hypothetical protein
MGARLVTLVVQKTVDVMAFTGENKEDETELKIFQELGLEKFNNHGIDDTEGEIGGG